MRERLAVFPFSFGCGSESSVDIGDSQNTKPKPKPETRKEEREESLSREKINNSYWGLLAIPKYNLADRIYKLVKSFKSFAQLFVYKEEEEMETDIEIGFPTDVKHVTHIGWDGTTTTNPVKGWENLTPPELLSFPSISVKQFELAMAAQANQPNSSIDTLQAQKI